jgi:hypothetical protein
LPADDSNAMKRPPGETTASKLGPSAWLPPAPTLIRSVRYVRRSWMKISQPGLVSRSSSLPPAGSIRPSWTSSATTQCSRFFQRGRGLLGDPPVGRLPERFEQGRAAKVLERCNDVALGRRSQYHLQLAL